MIRRIWDAVHGAAVGVMVGPRITYRGNSGGRGYIFFEPAFGPSMFRPCGRSGPCQAVDW